MRVFETQLPGVGRRYTMEFADGGSLVVLLRNNGTREVYWRDEPEDDSDPLFAVSEAQARTLGDILQGTYFEPVDDDLDEALTDARIRWVEVPADSPIACGTIREGAIRSRTGASILAIQRDGETTPNPTPDARIEAGDVLVVVGSAAAHDAVEDLLAGDLD